MSLLLALAVPAVALAVAGCTLSSDEAPHNAGQDQDRTTERRRMVAEQIRGRQVKDPAVLRAMERVPRHRFVPQELQLYAYDDTPLPIGFDQTISQPYIVGYMTEELELQPTHRVLEIGTGSGYQAAVLAEIVRDVYTIEIVEPLGERSKALLASMYKNVHVKIGDGYQGWPEHAPFDRVIVTAAPDHVPQPLLDQLAMGGRMVIPVGTSYQELLVIAKTEKGVVQRATIPVRFVPLTRKK